MIPQWTISTRFLPAWATGLVLALGAMGLLIYASENRIHACTCAQTPSSEGVFTIEYDAIFAGTVVAERPFDRHDVLSWPDYTYEIRVSTVWKGPVEETMFVSTGEYRGGSCGKFLRVGEEVLIYASAIGDNQELLAIGLCDPTGPRRNWEAVFEALGSGLQLNTSPLDESQGADAPKPPATGGCNIVAQTGVTPVDASLIGLLGGIVLGLLGGIVWFRARKHQHR